MHCIPVFPMVLYIGVEDTPMIRSSKNRCSNRDLYSSKYGINYRLNSQLVLLTGRRHKGASGHLALQWSSETERSCRCHSWVTRYAQWAGQEDGQSETCTTQTMQTVEGSPTSTPMCPVCVCVCAYISICMWERASKREGKREVYIGKTRERERVHTNWH